MNTRENMVIIKGEIKTPEIRTCNYNPVTKKVDVCFQNGRTYSYSYNNIEWLRDPKQLNPALYQISKDGRTFNRIREIYVFQNGYQVYWHICFEEGKERDYAQSELQITVSCLQQKQSRSVFDYLKQIAELSELRNEETGEKLLARQYEKITFIGNDTALAKYLNPASMQRERGRDDYVPIFPFGCNNSQYRAVKNAMESQISVIQGPPGTGKTQTILNIIANILMQGKTVQIVSNNNSATENVYEKLASDKYKLEFLVAKLGSTQNKKTFVSEQTGQYPRMDTWKYEGDRRKLEKDIYTMSAQLKKVYELQEELAQRKQEQSQLATELAYFEQYVQESDVNTDAIKLRKELSASKWMDLWQECQWISEEKQRISLLFQLKSYFYYGIKNLNFYKQEIPKIITTFQAKYYDTRKRELVNRIDEIENFLQGASKGLAEELGRQSMILLKDKIARKYEGRTDRPCFDENDLWKNPQDVLREYPITLSTTFSSKSSLGGETVYDYLIMDEASQVDIATGALALSCARNVVIVGDTKQLPNVVTEEMKGRAEAVFESFQLPEGYRYTKSFLQSVTEVLPLARQTLLREHYRCHPKIINFCNQKFYRGQLIIMTEDHGEGDVLSVIKTAKGNHARNHFSQRQIDVIREEVLPKLQETPEEMGIIAPYRNQVEALQQEFPEIDAATVHKFQGKEKNTIILSTVDDEISDFADDPYLINVAVSRAKKRLVLVVTGNEQEQERNISDLIDYIQYNNFEVAESETYSVFDYLYKQYTSERMEFLKKHKKISEYDSENLMEALPSEILAEERFACLDHVCHFPMNMLIRDLKRLEADECEYAMNQATHVDFLIYNRISKKPVLVIEVDGYKFHKENDKQAERDDKKNHILEAYQIPYLRLQTNGSGEKEKIIQMLEKTVE